MVCFLSILRLSNFKPYMTVVTCFIPSPLPAHISGYILLLLMPRFLFQPELRIICRTSCWSDDFCVEIYTYQDEFPVDILIWAALFLLCTSLVYYVLLDNRYLLLPMPSWIVYRMIPIRSILKVLTHLKTSLWEKYMDWIQQWQSNLINKMRWLR